MSPSTDAISYPLKMIASLAPKPWGGSRLAQYGKQLAREPIGESLESGSESQVGNGLLAGRTLGDLVSTYGRQLLGPRGMKVSGAFEDFPLLVKLIDANADLSVQVHPNDADAPSGKRGKTEAWLVLSTEVGARLIVGVDGPLDAGSIERQIVSERVDAGDVYFVAAGTVHAIGAGVLLYEIQQSSDVTFRLYDWGRAREMHWDDGVRSARTEQRATRVSPLALSQSRQVLAACRHFALERWTIDGVVVIESNPETFRIMTVLQGTLETDGVRANAGDTLVLPADLPDCSLDGRATLLLAYIPDLEADIIGPLLDAGHSLDAIEQLGIAW